MPENPDNKILRFPPLKEPGSVGKLPERPHKKIVIQMPRGKETESGVHKIIEQADRFFNEGNLQGALDLLNPINSSNADNPQLKCLFGDIYTAGRNPEGGLKFYQEALAIDPGFARAAIGLSKVLLAKSHPTEAIEVILKALEHNPTNPDLLAINASYAKSPEYGVAKVIYNNRDETNPEEIATEFRKLLLKEQQQPSPNLKKIILIRAELAKLFPKSRVEWVDLARAQEAAGRIDDALVSYNKALGCDYDNSETHFLFGRLFQKRGFYSSSIKHLEIVVNKQGEFYPEALFLLGQACWSISPDNPSDKLDIRAKNIMRQVVEYEEKNPGKYTLEQIQEAKRIINS